MSEHQEIEHLLKEEEQKTRRVRFLVDLTVNLLYQDSTLTLAEARRIVRNAERQILALFPDKQETFNLILLPRFERILKERFGAGVQTVH
ncbi:MAG: hypothetical protein HY645_06070 [Acidobacteria bacterium]|nr:hypothetical protein [Acidobacteriota bacterium]